MCVGVHAEGFVRVGPVPLCVLLFAVTVAIGPGSPPDRARFFSSRFYQP